MVSIVIPVFNERDSLSELADQVAVACDQLEGHWEAIFVDDGSTDGSASLLRELTDRNRKFKLVRLKRNFGKSAALATGISQSRGERIVTMDADLQDDPAEIPRLLEPLDRGFDLVSGWKRSRRDPFFKRVPSRIFNWVTAKLSGVRLHDFNCGFKAYRASAAKDLVLYGELYRYIPVIGAQKGWRITELEVNHRPRRHGKSKFGRERYLRGFFDLLTVLFMGRYRHRPLHLFGGLGVTLITIGAVISAYLSMLWFAGQSIGTRPLLLLGVLLIVVGVQMLFFGLIGEMIVGGQERQERSMYQEEKVDEVVSKWDL